LVLTKSAYSYGGTDIITLLYKPNSRNYASTAVLAMAWSSVALWRNVFFGAKVSIRHFGTSADMSGQFGTSADMSWVRSDLTPCFLAIVGLTNLSPVIQTQTFNQNKTSDMMLSTQ